MCVFDQFLLNRISFFLWIIFFLPIVLHPHVVQLTQRHIIQCCFIKTFFFFIVNSVCHPLLAYIWHINQYGFHSSFFHFILLLIEKVFFCSPYLSLITWSMCAICEMHFFYWFMSYPEDLRHKFFSLSLSCVCSIHWDRFIRIFLYRFWYNLKG